MTTVLLDDSNLIAIGDALRAKTGSTDLYKPREMAAAIEAIEGPDPGCTGMHIPEEALTITGNCAYKFAGSGWNWFIDELGDKITSENITSARNMFYDNDELTSIPFDFNFKTSSTYHMCYEMFNSCENLKEINGAINNLKPGVLGMGSMFQFCYDLRYLPQFNNLDMSYLQSNSYALKSMFEYCRSLRSIPEELLKQLYAPKATSYFNSFFCQAFQNCYTLDEIRGLNPQTGTMTSNMFSSTFSGCSRVKDIIFAVQEDGTPYSVNWKNQTIDLIRSVGYAIRDGNATDYNSGITIDKKVTNDATYQALKNDPDWFTTLEAYSRYNHDSAVNTINSLPDTSAYGINTIKFKGAAGSATDGGAINTLTEEEIAVATAKGWTVTLV